MKFYRITVTQLVPTHELDPDDQDIEGTYTSFSADSEEEALTEFHSSVPIDNLDHFQITCERVE